MMVKLIFGGVGGLLVGWWGGGLHRELPCWWEGMAWLTVRHAELVFETESGKSLLLTTHSSIHPL